MAIRGRKPKPVELKVLEGNPGKRPLPEVPEHSALTASPPEELPALGRNLWRRLVREFGETKLLQATDREALLVMCDLWAVYCDAMAKTRAIGTLVKATHHNSDRAAVTINPAWRVARDAIRELEQLWARFGLTPADRARIGMGGQGDEDDDTEEFLFGPRRLSPASEKAAREAGATCL